MGKTEKKEHKTREPADFGPQIHDEKEKKAPKEKKQPKAPTEKQAETFVDTQIEQIDIDEFTQYLAKFGKSYIDFEQFQQRLKNWKATDKFIWEHSWNKGSNYKLAHNKFSDWSQAEF